MFGSILENGTLTFEGAVLCTLASLACGVITAACSYNKKRRSNDSGIMICLIVLPAIVQTVIMLVNGNIGAGVAVAGTFSLVRFRSVQESSKEISAIFLSMTAGLATGMGYIAFALFFTTFIGAAIKVLTVMNVGGIRENCRSLKITIPENLEYEGVFDDLFEKYTEFAELERVKTTNMGTLCELSYIIRMKKGGSEKQLIDDIRCRNGNLTVVCGKIAEIKEE